MSQSTDGGAITVAVAHMKITADIRKNSQSIQVMMRRASAKQCRLIQFPEGSLSGYCKTQITSWDAYDWQMLEAETNKIRALAQELSIWVIVGSVHRLENQPPYNSLLVISDDGEIHARYDKRFISHGELQGWYSPGQSAVTFDVDGYVIGLALCLEVQFYEIFDEYRRLAVDAVLLSAYANDPMFEISARAHASLNNYWIGFSVPANMDTPLASSLIGPDGYMQSRSRKQQNSLAIATIDRHDERWDIPLNKAKPWRALARRGDIYR